MPPATELDCELDPPFLTNWNTNSCHNIRQHTSAIESIAEYICENLPEGGEAFITLSDTPDNYSGDALSLVQVNAGETGLEFVTIADVNGDLDHTLLQNIGTNTHAQIDTHIANTSNPHTTTLEQARTANNTMTGGFFVTTGQVAFNTNSTNSDFIVKTVNDNSAVYISALVNSIGIGTASPTGKLHISQPVSTGNVFPSLKITSAAHTALTTATERNEILWNLSATKQWTTGATIANQREIYIQAPTYSATAATQTFTVATTLEISGAPIPGTNASILIPYAFRVASGSAIFDGGVISTTNMSVTGGTFALSEAVNMQVGTATGTKIGTATTQKIGFWNKAPAIQPTALTTQLTTVTFTAPGTPDYAFATVQLAGFGFSTQDEGNTLLSVVANLQTRLSELETRLSTIGILP